MTSTLVQVLRAFKREREKLRGTQTGIDTVWCLWIAVFVYAILNLPLIAGVATGILVLYLLAFSVEWFVRRPWLSWTRGWFIIRGVQAALGFALLPPALAYCETVATTREYLAAAPIFVTVRDVVLTLRVLGEPVLEFGFALLVLMGILEYVVDRATPGVFDVHKQNEHVHVRSWYRDRDV